MKTNKKLLLLGLACCATFSLGNFEHVNTINNNSIIQEVDRERQVVGTQVDPGASTYNPFEGCTYIYKGYVAGVTVTPSELSMALNERSALSHKLSYSKKFLAAALAKKTVYWGSSDPNIASVDSSGNVIAMGYGTAYIYCKTYDMGYGDYCVVRVRKIEPTSIDIKNFPLDCYGTTISRRSNEEDRMIELMSTISPANSYYKTTMWESSDPSIAEIISNKYLYVKRDGTISLKAYVSGYPSVSCVRYVSFTAYGEGVMNLAVDATFDNNVNESKSFIGFTGCTDYYPDELYKTYDTYAVSICSKTLLRVSLQTNNTTLPTIDKLSIRGKNFEYVDDSITSKLINNDYTKELAVIVYPGEYYIQLKRSGYESWNGVDIKYQLGYSTEHYYDDVQGLNSLSISELSEGLEMYDNFGVRLNSDFRFNPSTRKTEDGTYVRTNCKDYAIYNGGNDTVVEDNRPLIDMFTRRLLVKCAFKDYVAQPTLTGVDGYYMSQPIGSILYLRNNSNLGPIADEYAESDLLNYLNDLKTTTQKTIDNYELANKIINGASKSASYAKKALKLLKLVNIGMKFIPGVNIVSAVIDGVKFLYNAYAKPRQADAKETLTAANAALDVQISILEKILQKDTEGNSHVTETQQINEVIISYYKIQYDSSKDIFLYYPTMDITRENDNAPAILDERYYDGDEINIYGLDPYDDSKNNLHFYRSMAVTGQLEYIDLR